MAQELPGISADGNSTPRRRLLPEKRAEKQLDNRPGQSARASDASGERLYSPVENSKIDSLDEFSGPYAELVRRASRFALIGCAGAACAALAADTAERLFPNQVSAALEATVLPTEENDSFAAVIERAAVSTADAKEIAAPMAAIPAEAPSDISPAGSPADQQSAAETPLAPKLLPPEAPPLPTESLTQTAAQQHERTVISIGEQLFREGKYHEAEVRFEEALVQNPQSAAALRYLGEVQLSNGNFERAAELFNESLLTEPDSERTRLSLAYAYDKLDQLPEAIREYRKASELSAPSALLLNNLGYCLLRQANLDEAEQFFKRALSLDPLFVRALYNLGDLYVMQNNLDLAVKYHEAAARYTDDHRAYSKLGDTFARAGMRQAAMQSYRKSLKLSPGYAPARESLKALRRLS